MIKIKAKEITVSELRAALSDAHLHTTAMLCGLLLVHTGGKNFTLYSTMSGSDRVVATLRYEMVYGERERPCYLTAPCESQFKAICDKVALRRVLRLFGNPEPTPQGKGLVPLHIAMLEI